MRLPALPGSAVFILELLPTVLFALAALASGHVDWKWKTAPQENVESTQTLWDVTQFF